MPWDLLERIRRSAYSDALQTVTAVADRLGLRPDDARENRKTASLEIPGDLAGRPCVLAIRRHGGWELLVDIDVPVLAELHHIGLCPALTGRAQEDYHLGVAALPGREAFDDRCAVTSSDTCMDEKLEAAARRIPEELLQLYCDHLDAPYVPYFGSKLLRLSLGADHSQKSVIALWRSAESFLEAGEAQGFITRSERG